MTERFDIGTTHYALRDSDHKVGLLGSPFWLFDAEGSFIGAYRSLAQATNVAHRENDRDWDLERGDASI